jgi:UDP-N-acetylglucosamine 2-epimerase
MLACFGLSPDVELALMRPDQTLASLTARLLEGVTTTVQAASLAAYYERVPVGHVEAAIFNEVQRLLDSEQEYSERSRVALPYGDGSAARKIVKILLGHDGDSGS